MDALLVADAAEEAEERDVEHARLAEAAALQLALRHLVTAVRDKRLAQLGERQAAGARKRRAEGAEERRERGGRGEELRAVAGRDGGPSVAREECSS